MQKGLANTKASRELGAHSRATTLVHLLALLTANPVPPGSVSHTCRSPLESLPNGSTVTLATCRRANTCSWGQRRALHLYSGWCPSGPVRAGQCPHLVVTLP